MGARGRKSAGDHLVIVADDRRKPPEPPKSLTPYQKSLWRSICASEPPGALQTAGEQQLLVLLVQHSETATRLARSIDSFRTSDDDDDRDDLRDYEKLLGMRERETKAIRALATSLRLSTQAKRSPGAAGTAARNNPTSGPPWQMRGHGGDVPAAADPADHNA